jgi:hypothetical protein
VAYTAESSMSAFDTNHIEMSLAQQYILSTLEVTKNCVKEIHTITAKYYRVISIRLIMRVKSIYETSPLSLIQ